MREIVAGLAVLAKPEHAFGSSSQVTGDALDIAVLVPALSPDNPRRVAAQGASALRRGVTVPDILCASALATGSSRRRQTARRTHVAAIERAVRA